ncbi:predicted protein [Aspergillus terreus NIH2624]|uniref:Uncharacterized protein n=1 Tax=Aspergillus terreus (strain NIH 2624 / FGSC A1156) TaxID=341663 RepID=Q0C8Q8_ASPTN|nr:uncharacterized protein ATEG_09926 [Aspergillus terreus NIH2624]EAU30117.1 predicted protein [Aspergillus terreus NIH2624]
MTFLIILFGLILGGIFCLEDKSPDSLNNDIATQISRWERSPSYVPTPGNFGHEQTPSVSCPSPAYSYGDRSSSSHRPTSDRLGFLEDTELNQRDTTQADTFESIKYLIEWKVTLNNRFLAKDTEQDLAYKPNAYWQKIKEKAERIVQRKKPRNQRVRLDDTIVTVTPRSETSFRPGDKNLFPDPSARALIYNRFIYLDLYDVI